MIGHFLLKTSEHLKAASVTDAYAQPAAHGQHLHSAIGQLALAVSLLALQVKDLKAQINEKETA